MGETLADLNNKRAAGYQKDHREENFYLGMNRLLMAQETPRYRDLPIEHPFIFVFGPPRSGTTLTSQVLAYCLDVGYINNLMARFWLAPLHGIKISQGALGEADQTRFESDYARTVGVADIHEFGYFWGHWLEKQSMEEIVRSGEKENHLDWTGLKRVLANMQNAFGKSLSFKNIYGAYHLGKMAEVLEKVIYVFIERDELDTAVSIRKAREKYYGHLDTWWSYTPVEYPQLKNLDPRDQIAGQIYFLKRGYNRQIKEAGLNNVVRIRYRDLCENPQSFLEQVRQMSLELYGADIPVKNQPPQQFTFRSYLDSEEKADFARRLAAFRAQYDHA